MANTSEYKLEKTGSKVSLWYTKKSITSFDIPNHTKDILFMGNNGKNTNCEEIIKMGIAT